jgi:hypothetical protein
MVSNADAHLVAHTVRMLRVLAEKPDHARAAEYADQIAAYRARWQAIPDGEQVDILHAVGQLDGMPEAEVMAAWETLKGEG